MNTKLTDTHKSTDDEILEHILNDELYDDIPEDDIVLDAEDMDIVSPDSSAKEPAKKSKWGSVLRFAVLIISAAIFCYSAYMLCSIIHEYNRDAKTNKKIDSIIVDSTTSVTADFPDGTSVTLPFKYDHQKLLNMNQEGKGYIYIPSISKRLPIVQTDNNAYYLRRAVDHTFSMAGSIFIDYRITDGIDSSHIILHGHNRQDGTMFAQLESYLKESFYKKSGNDVFYLYIDNKVQEYKIFSVYISEPISTTYAFNFLSDTTLQTYASTMQSQSLYETGIDVSEATQIVTLSTCTDDTENRIIVHGVLTNTGYIK